MKLKVLEEKIEAEKKSLLAMYCDNDLAARLTAIAAPGNYLLPDTPPWSEAQLSESEWRLDKLEARARTHYLATRAHTRPTLQACTCTGG